MTSGKCNYAALPAGKSPRICFNPCSHESIKSAFDLYRPHSIKGKLFRLAGIVLSYTGLIARFSFFRVTPDVSGRLSEFDRQLEGSLELGDITTAYLLGTPGKHQKWIARISANNRVTAYAKIAFANGFRKTFHFHWRPELLPRPGGKHKSSDHDGAPEPALESKYGLFMSLIRFSYYYGDFILGYWIRIYPRKAATSLVIGERYYYDILVHPERYGFSLPAWVYRVLIYFVPKPDMTILLSNEAEVIAERKDELPVEEIRRQLNAYREVIRLAGNGIEIRTEGSIDDVVQNVSQTVLNKTADKNRCCDS